ncbi:IgGFc-binding protein [Neosynchiropus ocellatus]
MQVVLLLMLLGPGLSGASPGRRFLTMFPPHSGPDTSSSHRVTITADEFWTSVSVQVLGQDFMQRYFLSAGQSKTIRLPLSVEMAASRSSHLLSVTSVWPVTVLVAYCTPRGCQHSLLHDVSSWGSHYYPVTPDLHGLALSQMVITSSDRETSVDLLLPEEVLFGDELHSKGSVLRLRLGRLQSVYLQSNRSLSGSVLYSTVAVGVLVCFTCLKYTPGECLHGFAQLRPVSRWRFDYMIPPLVNTGMSSSFLLAMSTLSSDLHVTTSTERRDVALTGGQVRVIPVATSDKVHVSSDAPLQLLYFRHDSEKHSSSLTSLLAVDDICEALPMSDSSDTAEPGDNRSDSDGKFSGLAKLSDGAGGKYSETDVGRYLSTLTRESYPEACEKASCEEMHCGHKHDCYFRDEKPQCSLKSKMCSAWGDSFYRSFDSTDFVLLGNCNYTLVQTNCPGSHGALSLQINIARAYLSSATLSNIHTVQINFQGFNISIVREEINYIRLNGRKRSLPLALKDGSLKFFPSGSSLVLVTSFGLTLHYDWFHHLQVEVTQELYGAVCGLCGGAGGVATKSAESWLVNSGGSCLEDCQGPACKVCPHDQRHLGNSIKCSLLKRPNGPFENCHQYVDPEAFARSCIDNLCITGMDVSGCKILEAYADICQRLGARVKDWRSLVNCPKTCPQNSHYEHCGTGCPATCADPEASLNCSLPCVESCQCNRGYLLSDGQCVEPTSCGCVHEGFYFPPKKSFWVGEQCREKCVCQPHSRKVMCAGAQCAQGEVCKVLDGERACYRHGPGFCVAKGDPHYTTFDGRRFDVHGNCTYLFASYCPTWGALEDFSVEVQNQMDASNVSFRRVKMTAVGYSVELSYKWRDKVKVNGLLLNLPLVLNRGKIKAYPSGLTTTLETDFGVVVTYTSDVLIVQVPKVFSGSLCGLCGNFNNNPDDDLAVEGGASESEAIGSWKTSRDCVDAVTLRTPGCRAEDMVLYQGKDFCGRLLAKDGAFQACHDVVDPQEFYDGCVYDLCHDKRKDLCQILSTYVVVCQEKGALMDEWRSPSFCELTCPANSEYQLCATERFDCVDTGLKSVVCKEGCFCKPGFFHDTVGCVPKSKCSCFSDGSYHFIDEVYYPDEHCRRRCVCVGHNKVRCSNHTCPVGTRCSIQDGDRACHRLPRSKCSVLGGGHFSTYSGDAFDLELGSCRYLLSQFCDVDEPTVEIEQSKMNVRYRGVHVLLDAKYSDKVKIDGVLVGLPVQLEHISVLHFGSLIRVFVDMGMVVTFGGSKLMQVEIPAVEGKICGLCGPRMASNPSQTAEGSSWLRTPHGTNCSAPHPPAPCDSESLGRVSSDGLCGRLLAPGGAFRNCHDVVNPEPFFQNCLKDLCASDNEESLCSSLREYSFVCQDAGAAVEPWRGTKCALACPDNSHYDMCVGTCPESCGSTGNIPCPGTCHEGCRCDAGYVLSGSRCVRPAQCGCLHEGHYHEVGEVFWTEGCYERCNCSATAKLSCEPATCPEGESCTLHDTWRCAGKGEHRCHCDPGFVLNGDTCVPSSHCGCTYNGERYLGNQTFWADESCSEQCYCDPDTFQTRCKSSSCGLDEYCGLEGGVISCVLHQWQLCTYTGHHLTTFDHHDYDLHGTCQYQLLGFCEGGPDLEAVQVHIQSDGHPLSAVNVLIRLSDVVVKLNSDSVEVNGTKKNLPFHFNHSAVAFSLGLHMYFYTDFGFGLSLSREGLLAIGVSRKYGNSTCGLCGNFNGDPDDDLTARGTKDRLGPDGFVKLWKSGQNPWCVDGCLGGSCPTCTSERSVQYSDLEACGKILAVNGPFRHCHGRVDPSRFYQRCVTDLCLHGYHQPLLCRALSAYTAACLVRGAEVLPWSRSDFCGDSCPANTRYSTRSTSAHLCLGWGNRTVELPLYTSENCVCEAGLVLSGSHCVLPQDCGCFHHGEYMRAGQTALTCEQSCTCHAGGHVSCHTVSCGEDEECSFVGGVRGCRPKPRVADCSMDGSHYTTFDGQIFDFHGSCNYTLVETCRPESSGGRLLIYTSGNYSLGRQMSVQVKNMSLRMSSDFPGFLQVNGVEENFPFSQAGVTVYQENEWRTIKAPMVEVKTDLHNHVRVRLSGGYRHTTCGLCGNYNDDPADDMKLRGGSVVADAEVFGASWKSEKDSDCSDSCDDSCHLCMAALPQYTSELYCGVMTHPGGPFAPCHVPVPPQKYYSFCMESLCVAKGAKWALCDALQTYAAACEEAGVALGRWRADTSCACPPNSHYETCGTACPATCQAPSVDRPCTLACVPGCYCDPGFVLNGDTCVPSSHCGCTYNGERYLGNQTFWADESCSEQCYCDPDTFQTRCKSSSCGLDEYCGLEGGVISCVLHQWQLCTYTGHHLTTFDHHDYDLHGTCQYQLLGFCEGGPDLEAVQVHIQSDGHPLSAVNVLIRLSDVVVKLNSDSVEVNGTKKNLPFHFNHSAVAFSLGLHMYFYTDFGFGLSLSREGLLAIGVSRKYGNSTCGLCGNFNGDPDDDLTARGTKDRLGPDGFVKLWKSEQNPWCVDGCLGGSCPTCTSERSVQYSDLEACGKILEVNGPFRHCHARVDPSRFYQRCVTDLCLHGYHQPLLCRALSAYTAACLVRGAEVLPWSRSDFCGDSCPANTRYSTRSTSAHLCLGWGNRTVELPLYTSENCVCEAGLVLSGSHCVLPQDCGCFHHGEYMRAGQTALTCEQSCTCHAGGHVSCHTVSCGEDEECSFVGGVRGCRPKPRVADCSMDGSHYTTFDGQIFDFHGSCNYTLVETCRPESSGGRLLIYTSGNYSLGRQMSVQVKNMSLRMSSDFPGFLQVNGVEENIPFSQAGVTVYQENEWRTIKAPMVEVKTDLHNHVRVRLSGGYRHTTCGLCGNYNDDPADDMKLRSGSVVADAEVFGASWKSGKDSDCSDSCDDSCHLCMAALPQYTSELYCGVMTHPGGPFAPCHVPVPPQKYYSFCMESLCVAKGAKWALCDALQTYAAACEEAGVALGRWRADTSCGRQCPQFSHFSRCANACASLCPETNLPLQCPTDCEEGCACDAGRLYDGHACVAPDQCGCVRDGRRFKVSESRLLHNCTLNCTCGPPLICEPHKCPSTHSCQVVYGRAGCWMKAEQHQDPCAKCGPSETCYLNNGRPVCRNRPGQCWAWGSRHYYTFDGLEYNFESSCTYLLAGSKGEDCCLPPFIVSKKNGRKTMHYLEVVTVQVYGFVIKLNDDFTVHVNGQAQTPPFTLSRGKVEVSYKHGRALLKTDFGLQVLYDWRTTVSVTVDPKYRGVVYGLCGNFNGNPQDEFESKSAAKMSSALTHLYRVFDGDARCCDGCAEEGNTMVPLADAVSKVALSYRKACDALTDPNGPYAQCHSRVNPDSFFQSCLSDLMQYGDVKESLQKAMNSYSMLCEEAADEPAERAIDVTCPENSHFKTCGSACPPTCERNVTACRKVCTEGCFCDPGFIRSPEGCVQPRQCGCTDSRGNYHRLNTTFWIPEGCGQQCVCSQAGAAHCSPSQCPKGMACKRGRHVDLCLPEKSLNCTIVSGFHFTTFDGYHFDFSDSCAYSLVQTRSDLKGLEPFNITVSDASCQRRVFHSRSIKLSIHGLEFEVRKDDPGKLLVGGEHMALPLAHHTGHVNAFHTPSSLVIRTDVGLQMVVYKTGGVTVVMPSSYDSSVVGLCGNANGSPDDDRLMPNEEPALNTLEFVHSWRLGGAESCRSVCSSKTQRCSAEAREQFEGGDFCGVLVNELGPFADCASVLDPETYFHNCVVDSCSHGGHYTAVCNSIAAYAAACQSAHLPVRHWRSDTFCAMSCPRNSHYELCGPRCPVTCAGLSSPATCSGGCEEGCQCDPGYVLSDGQCVLTSDCGCTHEDRYYPAGLYYSGRGCQKCNCKREMTCRPSSCSPSVGYPVKGGLVPFMPLDHGVCEVVGSYGYITFDGLVVPLHGACTYLLSSLASKVMHDYTLLSSFDSSSRCSISRLDFRFLSTEVVIDPASLWKIQVNGEDHIVPFDNGFVKAYQEGDKLSVASPSGVRLVLSSSCFLRLIVPKERNATASGLCGNFNGDKSDDLEMPVGRLARSFGEFLQSWAAVVPGQHCADTCGELCGECNVSPVTAMACDVLTISTVEFNPCWARGVDPQVYKEICLRAICSGAGRVQAVCLALEAFTAACQAQGVALKSWWKATSCALECPDRSSPSECVEAGSDSCPALLQSGSSVAACSGGCKCDRGNVFDGDECVPYSQCGCVLHDRYIKLDEQLYTENCAQRCWCHPLGGVICETAGCSAGQYCALRNGSWGCHEEAQVCRLTGSLDVSTFSGQRLNLQSQLSYNLMSVCNEASEKWFSIISFHGPCEPASARESSVFKIHLPGSSVVVRAGAVKVDGLDVSLPHTLSSGVTLSAGVTPDKSEVLVLLRRDSGTQSELQMDVGVTMVTVRVSPWFSGKLCGLCGNLNDRAQQSAAAWVLPNLDGCDAKLG